MRSLIIDGFQIGSQTRCTSTAVPAGAIPSIAARAKAFLTEHASVLTLSMDEWMTPFVMLGFTQVGREQGEYAAETALKILEGTNPMDIPIIANRQWNLFINESLLNKAGIDIPKDLRQKGKKVE